MHDSFNNHLPFWFNCGMCGGCGLRDDDGKTKINLRNTGEMKLLYDWQTLIHVPVVTFSAIGLNLF